MDKPFLKNKSVTVLLHTLPGPVRRLDVLSRYRNFLLIIVMADTLELVKHYQNGRKVMKKTILFIMASLLASYYKVIYKVQEHHLVPEERWITEYVDGQPITRKDDHVE